jgi:hypothetical protein
MAIAKPDHLKMLEALEKKVLWLSSWMIHNANHLRPKGEVKVGGHQASSASLASVMTALYFHVLRPEDRVAVKPHAAPLFHAAQYLMGNQSRDKLMDFRGYGGAQSYPSRTKDVDDVDFSTGSVGLGVAITSFASIVQDYLETHGLQRDETGRMMGSMKVMVESLVGIIGEVRSDQQADLLGRMGEPEMKAILEQMTPRDATDARRLLDYSQHTAGGLMMTEYLAYPGDWTVAHLITELKSERRKTGSEITEKQRKIDQIRSKFGTVTETLSS